MKKNRILSFLIVALVFVLAGCGSGVGTDSAKGTYKDPYSLDDSFEFVAGNVVPWSYMMPGGRKVTDLIKFKISNIQVKQWTVTQFPSYSDFFNNTNGKDNENFYFVTYDIEIVESDIFETIYIYWDYFKLYCLGTDGQKHEEEVNSPSMPSGFADDLIHQGPTVVPIEGKSWSCYSWLAPKNKEELDYVLFHYCGEDGEFHDIYVKVD